jgi:hypothetical protein
VELLVNAIEHGNLGLTYTEKSALKKEDRWEEEIRRRLEQAQYRGRRAVVNFFRTSEVVQFSVIDEGDGFKWERYLDFDPDRVFDPNGRGIAMAGKMAFSRLEYRGKGNHVVAEINLRQEEE